MKAIVDKDLCIGCGLCPGICPEVFKMEDDKAIVYTNPVPENAIETCNEAKEQCPSEAIRTEG